MKKKLQATLTTKRSYSWLEMLSIGLGVLGIGLLIAIIGYVLQNQRVINSSLVIPSGPSSIIKK